MSGEEVRDWKYNWLDFPVLGFQHTLCFCFFVGFFCCCCYSLMIQYVFSQLAPLGQWPYLSCSLTDFQFKNSAWHGICSKKVYNKWSNEGMVGNFPIPSPWHRLSLDGLLQLISDFDLYLPQFTYYLFPG